MEVVSLVLLVTVVFISDFSEIAFLANFTKTCEVVGRERNVVVGVVLLSVRRVVSQSVIGTTGNVRVGANGMLVIAGDFGVSN